MATKHMNAAAGDFADTVLMPGDPLRAQYIADAYLDGAGELERAIEIESKDAEPQKETEEQATSEVDEAPQVESAAPAS